MNLAEFIRRCLCMVALAACFFVAVLLTGCQVLRTLGRTTGFSAAPVGAAPNEYSAYIQASKGKLMRDMLGIEGGVER